MRSELVSTVSCGGNLIVNVGPNAHGILEPIFVERLYAMGRWLEINGEAIYSSIPWKYQNDTVTPEIWYTAQRPNNGRQNVYASVLNYPYDDNDVNLASARAFIDDLTKFHLLGYDKPLIVHKEPDSVWVTFPNKQELDKLGLDLAWTLRFDIPV